MTKIDADSLLQGLLPAVLEAGRAEMRHFRSGVSAESKSDSSPVTVADREAEAILVAALGQVAPEISVIAEELAAAGQMPPPQRRFFLVDALDGTRYFIKGLPEFSINVGLVSDGEPVFGLIYSPAAERLYANRSDGKAYVARLAPDAQVSGLKDLTFRALQSRQPDRANLVAFSSRASGGSSADFLKSLAVREARPYGSSEKFALIADGVGDLYPRFGPTYEWDTAAGQAILEAAGGSVTTLEGARLGYGKSENRYLNPGFVAWGRERLGP